MLSDKIILIVEDNAFIALDLAMAVEQQNGSVVGPVGTVAEALLLIDVSPLSGAILDCQLADRDIEPVISALVDRGIPLVIQTGTEVPVVITQAQPQLSVLRKPLQPANVLKVLADVIRTSAEMSVSKPDLD